TQTTGLGIDFSEGAILEALAQPQTQKKKVKFEKADVIKLNEQMPDVDIFMQAFLSHHFLPDSLCCEVFQHYKEIFPSARYCLLLDTIDEEQDYLGPEIFYPGFEYIHSLRGVKPRSYSKIIELFDIAGFSIEKEVKLPIPNSYFWGLKINR
ncbi:MAG TPA: hypothetical protein DHV52_01495, partial [Parachlamydiales bacterium]|nr:hypothetical protein [Parachlamydiales bacterium]